MLAPMRVLLFATFAVALMATPADSPFSSGAKPVNEGSVNAGEGPAWDGKGALYFTGGNRIDAPGKVSRVLGADVERANGVLVSPDDQFLYVADNNNNNTGGARKLWRFRLAADGAVDASTRKLIYDWQDGRGPDGLKM